MRRISRMLVGFVLLIATTGCMSVTSIDMKPPGDSKTAFEPSDAEAAQAIIEQVVETFGLEHDPREAHHIEGSPEWQSSPSRRVAVYHLPGKIYRVIVGLDKQDNHLSVVILLNNAEDTLARVLQESLTKALSVRFPEYSFEVERYFVPDF